MNFYRYLLFISATILFFTSAHSQQHHIKVGADVLFDKYFHLIEGKSIGVICNHTSILSNGKHLVEALLERGIKISALFSPEHGIRGDISAGVKIPDQIDEATGLRVYSLYGNTMKPTQDMLENIEILLFDLQDVGARFYTYSVTMGYAMQAAAEKKIKLVILDRPNPIDGINTEGPILNANFKSGVGIFPIPIRHGLTLGEMAKMAVGESWLENISDIELVVIPLENWKREFYYDEIDLKWIPLSPNMKNISTALVYPGACLIEGTNISEGRGTQKPFEYLGAPWIDGKKLASKLNKLKLKGVSFEPIRFTPRVNTNTKVNLKYDRELCGGIFINVSDRKSFEPVKTGYFIISEIFDLYPDKFKFHQNFFDKLAGTESLRNSIILQNKVFFKSPDYIDLLKKYNKIRKKYLIYQ